VRPDPGRLVAVDAAAIAVVSVAICLSSKALLLMTVLVPAVIVLRTALVLLLARGEGPGPGAELALLAVCTLLGGFNDWNSVCNHGIYDYTVPHYVAWSEIPVWILLFWGLILRFIARLARWDALGAPERISNRVGIGQLGIDNPLLKVIAELVLVLATRQTIYRLYLDPIWSWAPLAAALVVFLVFFRPTAHDFKLLGLFLLGGPLIEVLYIQVGDLHRYHLGWLGGVPLWIALWWLVIVLIWKDVAFRIERALRLGFGKREMGGAR